MLRGHAHLHLVPLERSRDPSVATQDGGLHELLHDGCSLAPAKVKTARVLAVRPPLGHAAAVDQYPMELILVRHLASRLAVPVFIVDAAGDLVYFNEPAERVLGRRYDEIRIMPFEEWTTAFLPSADGRRLDPAELPLVAALRQMTPAHSQFEIVNAAGARRRLEVTAFPVIAPSDHLIGAVAMFWESDPE